MTWRSPRPCSRRATFTNSDTAINNFAGIAHYDGAASGSTFVDPIIGVRPQIQLLKKYALGNDTPRWPTRTSHPEQERQRPRGSGLAGTWASATTHWTSLSAVYESMLAHADTAPDPANLFASLDPLTCPGGNLAVSGDYGLPVERRWYDQNPRWFTKPPPRLPRGRHPRPHRHTPLFAVTNGVVVGTPTSGKCGVGAHLQRRRRRPVHLPPRQPWNPSRRDRRPRRRRATHPRQRIDRQQHRTAPPLRHPRRRNPALPRSLLRRHRRRPAPGTLRAYLHKRLLLLIDR